MTNKANESFSAFLDGEASELDIQRLLKAMDENPKAMNDWQGLSQAQAIAQGDVVMRSAPTLFQPEQSVTVDKSSPVWPARLMQGGIAAAVMGITLGLSSLMLDPQSEDLAPVQVSTITEPSSALTQQQFEAQQRLDVYLREHAEQAAFSTGHVVLPDQLEWIEAAEE